MKCQNCGNNNATFHYMANINGQTSEQHLCADCAEKTGYTDEGIFGGNMFDSMLNDFFRGFFTPARNTFFPEFGRLMMPVMTIPRIEFTVKKDEAKGERATEKVAEKDEDMTKRREINAIRQQLNSAIEAEEFEKAAELRDKIRELEKKD